MRIPRTDKDRDDIRRTGTPVPGKTSIAALHPLIRLLARQAARDCFNSHVSPHAHADATALSAEVPVHDDDPI